MSAFRIIIASAGALSFAAAAWHAIVAHSTDSEMQRFRVPDAPARKFMFIPLRWRHDLYSDQGKLLVDKAWHHHGLVYLFGVIGAGLLVASGVF